MTRLAPAAQQLVEQVRDQHPAMSWKVVGEPDGYRVYRQVRFDTETSSWLRPILDAIRDVRITDCSPDEQMVVTFVGDTRADWRDPYPLAIVAKVLYEPSD